MAAFQSEPAKKLRRAIVEYAIFRWESAVVLAGTILLTGLFPKPFPWWPFWGWPVLGLIGLAAVITSSLTNTERNARLMLKLVQESYDLSQIVNPELRRKVESALEYQRRIDAQIREHGPSLLWERAEDTANQINDWIGNIYRLATRLDAYGRDAMLQRDRERLPEEIDGLARRRSKETNPTFQQDLDEVLESKRKHLDVLEALAARMKQAELHLEQSLAALATVDSQVRLLDAQDVESGRSERLRADIGEQTDKLNDLVASINEVYEYDPSGVGR